MIAVNTQLQSLKERGFDIREVRIANEEYAIVNCIRGRRIASEFKEFFLKFRILGKNLMNYLIIIHHNIYYKKIKRQFKTFYFSLISSNLTLTNLLTPLSCIVIP